MSLLAHVANRFGSAPEPLATEALSWLLQHPAAAEGLARLLQSTGPGLPPSWAIRHQQVAKDKSRPDLVGYDSQGRGRLVIEVKFDAGLMASQPVAYLRQATAALQEAREDGASDAAAIVLFVVPEERVENLGPVLASRARDGGWPDISPAGASAWELEAGLRLICLSWRQMLSTVETGLAMDDNRSRAAGGDIEDARRGLLELRHLVARYERPAYTPLSSEDLTSLRLPVLWLGLTSVITAAVGRVCGEPDTDIDKTNLSYGTSPESWGQYLHVAGVECWLGKHADHWSKYGQGPLWLSFNTKRNPKRAALLQEAVGDWSAAVPARLVVTGTGNTLIPMRLDPDADRDQAVAVVAEQLREVASRLARAQETSGSEEGLQGQQVEPEAPLKT